MNDIMSLEVIEFEKKFNFLDCQKYNKIIDVASGTGDIAKLCSAETNNESKITCVEPNSKMLSIGKKVKSFE